MNIINENVISTILNNNYPCDKNTTITWSLGDDSNKPKNNHLSEVTTLTINLIRDGKKYQKYFFVKLPFNSPVYEYGSAYKFYFKEKKMYAEVLPQLYQIAYKEYFTPKFYYADEKYTLILEDLSRSGYEIKDRIQQLDFEHSAHALKRLAIFHGLSVKLEEKLGIDDIIKNDPFYLSDLGGKKFLDPFPVVLNVILEQISPEIKFKYAEKIRILKNVTWDDIKKEIFAQENSFNVLNHGDYWTSNILFKYDKYGSIKETKIIDFQLCRWANPVVDLFYFTISSMQFEVFEKHFDLLLQIYLNTLNKVLSKFHCQLYEMDQLKSDINSRFRYFISLIFFPLALFILNPKKAHCNENMIRGLEFNPCSLGEAYHDEHYVETAKKWLLYYLQNETICKK